MSAIRTTRTERRERGRAARQRVKRRELGPWDPTARSRDALETVTGQNGIRDAALVPIRHARMAATRWTYYRGAAAVMAADLAATPNTGLDVQLCGDAHVLNFGLWATPERNLSFDLRDFDETLTGPFEWDVKRLVASLHVVARENDLPEATAEDAVAAALGGYRRRLAGAAKASELEVWYSGIHVDSLVSYFDEEDRERVAAYIERKGKRRTSRGSFKKLTTVVDGHHRISEDPPRRIHIEDTAQLELVEAVIEAYRSSLQDHVRSLLDRFTVYDVVRQVVGVGSVGLRVYLVLAEGRGGDDPLFLQIKQAGPSVYEQHLLASPYRNHGARVVNGKRFVQTATDIFAGWTSASGMDFYVRQFRDMKVVPDSERIAPHLVQFAEACGEVLARAHAKTGDAMAIDAYIGDGRVFDRALAAFARTYAQQNEADHGQMAAAAADGSIETAIEW